MLCSWARSQAAWRGGGQPVPLRLAQVLDQANRAREKPLPEDEEGLFPWGLLING